jgi:hypothetical protein
MRLTPSTQIRTPFGLKDGRMVAPAEVESGLDCGCTCLGCGDKLIAKKGAKRAWHFAHHVVLATQSCVETGIHAAAKQILLENDWLQVPEKVVTVTDCTKFGATITESRPLRAARKIRFDYSRDEVWEAGSSLRPDVVGYRGTRRLPDDEKRMVVILQPDQFDAWLHRPVDDAPVYFTRFPAGQLAAVAAPRTASKPGKVDLR